MAVFHRSYAREQELFDSRLSSSDKRGVETCKCFAEVKVNGTSYTSILSLDLFGSVS
jgi:hypothetical protein